MENINKRYKLGLALSGGGARGFAHLGVIQAMNEYGIKPDIISGTSAGAIAGAMIASGHSPQEALNFFMDKKVLYFARFTMSKMGLMNMTGMKEHLGKFLATNTFEDLKIPLVVTASNLREAVAVHFESGPLLPCVLASASIPVVFIPTEINNSFYVDGGVFMNLPVRPIRERCERVIAVEINSLKSDEKITNMVHMAERSFHLGLDSNTKIDRKMADLFIEPENMTRFSIFDLKHIQDIYDEGYKAGIKVLKNFKA